MSDTNQPSDGKEGSVDDLWADALNEQKSTESADDPWAEALNEQKEAESKPAASSDGIFRSLEDKDVTGSLQDIDLIMDIPVKLTVELGRTRMTIKELLKLTQGSIVSLEGLAGEPLDILINGYLIAQGEVVVVADKYGVRITDIITPSERMRRLSR
ncbi:MULTISPECIES: flagellar motor switch protein FliN [Mangrovibacter]|uniref:Flagellar motor switch protein FliN n=2 Tax=Mangrovibacter TaxID=451512 RepID=A0A1B7L8I4_9ENTR|nr:MULTISPECIES: flagellar motor switch protein FliN [Mangrovibacter]KEA54623.1 flagellar motor switch protein FliN [Mangrovibacter sp. MFB070]OAT78643.1 flagellar motor switch protein FliN [Mangrovibacter phragmitis]PWW07784.1 flagellar motor switch protein FliN/FliY [Mangrovibacter plantisponsor]